MKHDDEHQPQSPRRNVHLAFIGLVLSFIFFGLMAYYGWRSTPGEPFSIMMHTGKVISGQ